jgi:hypothetical protein
MHVEAPFLRPIRASTARAILPYFTPMALLSRLLERLSRPAGDIRAESLRAWVATLREITPIAQVEPRKRYRVAGVIENIRIDPREGTGSIEATIVDGSGRMVARWLGRSSLRGIKLGTGLIMEGIAGRSEHDECVILNPEYELVPGPEHG